MTTPTVSTFTVVQTVEQVEAGDPPTLTPIADTVTFTPSLSEIVAPALGATIVLSPIHGEFGADDGILHPITDPSTVGVELVDSTNLGLDPGELTYRVDYSVNPHPISSFRFTPPGDGSTVDLDLVDLSALPDPTSDEIAHYLAGGDQ